MIPLRVIVDAELEHLSSSLAHPPALSRGSSLRSLTSTESPPGRATPAEDIGSTPPGDAFASPGDSSRAGRLSLYVAAPVALRMRAWFAAAALEHAGWCVRSTWYARTVADESAASPAELATLHEENLRELRAADALVVLTDRRAGRETYSEIGRYFERMHMLRQEPLVLWIPGSGGASLGLRVEPGVVRCRDLHAVIAVLELWEGFRADELPDLDRPIPYRFAEGGRR